MPGDEELGFEAAVAALGESSRSSTVRSFSWTGFLHAVCAGMKTTVSEAEHPLLCEGTRRVKGDLALALMITYKDDQCKLKKVKRSLTCRPSCWSRFLLWWWWWVMITPTRSAPDTPEELISLGSWETLKVHWWEFLVCAVRSQDSLSAKEFE